MKCLFNKLTKPQETLEFELTKSKETFSFKPPIQIEGSWVIGLTSLELYNHIFNITEENNKLDLYTGTFDEFSLTELKDELEEMRSVSDITPSHLQHEVIVQRNNKAYKKLRLEKSSTDGYLILLMGYARSPFQDFESYLLNWMKMIFIYL